MYGGRTLQRNKALKHLYCVTRKKEKGEFGWNTVTKKTEEKLRD